MGGGPFILPTIYEKHLLFHILFGAKRMSETEDRWLSIREICEHLGVISDTVYKWIDKYAMPAHRMGRLWKFKKDEVDEWVKAGGARSLSNSDKKE